MRDDARAERVWEALALPCLGGGGQPLREHKREGRQGDARKPAVSVAGEGDLLGKSLCGDIVPRGAAEAAHLSERGDGRTRSSAVEEGRVLDEVRREAGVGRDLPEGECCLAREGGCGRR